MTGSRLSSVKATLAGIALVAAVGGVAVAAIPGSDRSMTACVTKNGDIRAVDAEAGESCREGQATVRLATADAAGRVADSDRLDGIDSAGFVRGNGRVISNRVTATAGGNVTVLELPDFGTIGGRCYADSSSGSGLDFGYTNTTADPMHVSWDEQPRDLRDDGVFAPGLGVVGPGFAFTSGNDRNRVIFMLGRDVGAAHRLATATVMGFQSEGSPSSCLFIGQAVLSGG